MITNQYRFLSIDFSGIYYYDNILNVGACEIDKQFADGWGYRIQI